MEAIVEDIVDPSDLKKFERMYKEQEKRGSVSEKAQFEYAWCLVRSRYQNDMKNGIALLEDLFHRTKDDTSRRDYLYYLTIAYTRIKDYTGALKCCEGILKIEPRNYQALQLQKYINDKMKKEGLVGMAIVGGAAALALGGIIGLGMALSKK
ncbi:mitochondrial fission 1 protein-like [Liolophura sinensis]|uniref:mitochondrial fission 1 protein-like n=1 Tax=Liolophura sinensis TaxID=3198878 RepID=UPI00315931B2